MLFQNYLLGKAKATSYTHKNSNCQIVITTIYILQKNRRPPPCSVIVPKQILTCFLFPATRIFFVSPTQLNRDIGELNSQTRDMHSAETLTIGASFTYYAGGYIKVGRVVIVSLSFFVKYDALGAQYTDIISGLPLPMVAAPLTLWTFKKGGGGRP